MQSPFLSLPATVLSTTKLPLTPPTNRRRCLPITARFGATYSPSPLPVKLNTYSSRTTKPKSRGQGESQAMLSGVGLPEDDLSKQRVWISPVWHEENTCNVVHLLKLSEAVKRGVEESGMVGVTDMMPMGMGGVGKGLGTRDFTADTIETVMSAHDGYIYITGCNKNCYGENVSGKISDEQGKDTGNIIASAVEVMGMSLPCSSSISAEDPLKLDECRLAGKCMHELVKMDIKVWDIISHKSLRNATVVFKALGGSADDVLDLIAIARSVGVELTFDDFQKISDEVPFLADVTEDVLKKMQKATLVYLMDRLVVLRNVADIEEKEPKGEPSLLEMWTRAFETVGAFFTQVLRGYAAKLAGNMMGALATATLTTTPLKRGTLSALMVRIPVVDLAVKILGIILENSPSHVSSMILFVIYCVFIVLFTIGA
ncbi:hypothetical protein V6N13_123459 [Hibiscus sabdariffa]